MVIVYPYKKPKLEICEYNYCDGNHKISKCDGNQCDSNHSKSKKTNKVKNSPNPFLKYALNNSMELRFAQEKLQQQLVKNEEYLDKISLEYTTVSNLSEFEMEHDKILENLNEEKQSDIQKKNFNSSWYQLAY